MSLSRLSYLLNRYLDKVCTEQEYEELLRMLEDSRYNDEVTLRMDNVWNSLTVQEQLSLPKSNEIFKNILSTDVPVVSLTQRKWFRVSVAAAVLLVIVSGAFIFNRTINKAKPEVVIASHPKYEILPGGNRATLTLADGTSMFLDTAAENSALLQGNTRVIILKDGQLSYKPDDEGNAGAAAVVPTGFNTISTPKGGQYQIVLPDGSLVWLNSVSSLKFPVAFTGAKREVILTGEAYFDIKSNKNQPFHVNVNNADIEVLGTEFNVMAYNDEDASRATVVKGSIKVINTSAHGKGVATLTPGGQAEWAGDGILARSNVDIAEVTAWKNGTFIFNNATIQTIMRQAARWYDIDVEYTGSTKELFNGSLPRSVSAATLFRVFESTGSVKFIIEGKKVNVKL